MFRLLLFVLLTAVYALILAWPVEILWNLTLPRLVRIPEIGLHAVPPIGFWQAAGVVAIARVLHALRLLGFLLWTAILSLLLGWLVAWLWNLALPGLLHLPAITYWQAVGLVALLHLVFGSIGHFHHRAIRCEKRDARRARIRLHAHPRLPRNASGAEWKAWRDEMREWGRSMKREGGGWACDSAPGGHHRNWRKFDEYWKEEGRDAFDAWLRRRDGGS